MSTNKAKIDLSSIRRIKASKLLFNKAFLPYIDCNTRTQIFFGGSSSGKSHFIVGQRVVRDVLTGTRNYLILRKVARDNRKSTFNQVCNTIDKWGFSRNFKVNQSDMVITACSDCQIFFEGLDDVEKLKSIKPKGSKDKSVNDVITDILIEEATQVTRDEVKLLRKRLRGKSCVPKRITMLFNPILKSHWIYKDYFEGRWDDTKRYYHDDGLLIHHSTYKDNDFLEKDDIAELEDETNQYYHNVYTKGIWGVLGGVIFTNWRIEDLSLDIPRFDKIKNGLDFGYGSDPCAFTRLHHDKTRKRIYIINEWSEKGLTNPQISDRLRPIIKEEIITCDSAEPKSIQELRDNGINAIGAKKGKDSVNYGIQFLQQYDIVIDQNCPESISEFEQYQWKKDRNGQTLHEPVDKSNHHLDCFVGDTKVTTKRGDVRIDSLLDNDEVLTRNGYKKIVWHGKVRKSKTFIVILNDGTKLECTNTHKFVTVKNGKVPLYKIENKDILLKNRGGIFNCAVNQLFTMVRNILNQKKKNIIQDHLANFVENLLYIINMLILKRVHVVVQIETEQEKNVYNIQVDSASHEYFADGILVGNSIRYALESEMSDDKAQVTPRIGFVSPKYNEYFSPDKIDSIRGKLKQDETLIPIYEGDKVVNYEIIRRNNTRRGIYLPGIR